MDQLEKRASARRYDVMRATAGFRPPLRCEADNGGLAPAAIKSESRAICTCASFSLPCRFVQFHRTAQALRRSTMPQLEHGCCARQCFALFAAQLALYVREHRLLVPAHVIFDAVGQP